MTAREPLADTAHPGSTDRKPRSMVLTPAHIAPFDRGSGVATLPYVGKWNCDANRVTTGTTTFEVGTAIPLHTHNVEETVLVVRGQATAVIEDQRFELEPGDATWVPAGVPHCFINRGQTQLVIYWVYGGRDVTRTVCATGKTVEHLSDEDRGATAASDDQ